MNKHGGAGRGVLTRARVWALARRLACGVAYMRRSARAVVNQGRRVWSIRAHCLARSPSVACTGSRSPRRVGAGVPCARRQPQASAGGQAGGSLLGQ